MTESEPPDPCIHDDSQSRAGAAADLNPRFWASCSCPPPRSCPSSLATRNPPGRTSIGRKKCRVGMLRVAAVDRLSLRRHRSCSGRFRGAPDDESDAGGSSFLVAAWVDAGEHACVGRLALRGYLSLQARARRVADLCPLSPSRRQTVWVFAAETLCLAAWPGLLVGGQRPRPRASACPATGAHNITIEQPTKSRCSGRPERVHRGLRREIQARGGEEGRPGGTDQEVLVEDAARRGWTGQDGRTVPPSDSDMSSCQGPKVTLK